MCGSDVLFLGLEFCKPVCLCMLQAKDSPYYRHSGQHPFRFTEYLPVLLPWNPLGFHFFYLRIKPFVTEPEALLQRVVTFGTENVSMNFGIRPIQVLTV